MRALHILAGPGSEETTTELGAVIRSDQLVDVKETILDPEVLEQGVSIPLPGKLCDLWGRPIEEIRLPAMGRPTESGGMLFIHGIQILGNAILRSLEDGRGEIQDLVLRYQLRLLDHLAGKNGLLARGVLGTRLPNSGRLVGTPSTDRNPGWVGIHRATMERTGTREGDLVLVGRDPVIHEGSIEILRAYPIHPHTMTIHPLLFAGFGLDCDGDTVFFIRPNLEEPKILTEMAAYHLAWTKKNARWPKSLCPEGLPDVPDWSQIEADTERRFRIGHSYCPRDVLAPTGRTRELEALAGKPFIERNTKIVRGEEILETVLRTTDEQTRMKRELGLVGATARRLILLAGQDPWIRQGANVLSERLQQMKLDAKHDVESLDTMDLFDMFERRGKWRHIPVSALVRALEGVGIERRDSYPVLAAIRIVIPVYEALRELRPDAAAGWAEQLREELQKEVPNLPALMKRMRVELSLDEKEFRRAVESNTLGLREIVQRYCPGMSLLDAQTDVERIRFYERMVIRGEPDQVGLLPVLVKS